MANQVYEKKRSLEDMRQNNRQKRVIEADKTLSTITEEAKSYQTSTLVTMAVSRYTKTSSEASSTQIGATRNKNLFPPLPKQLPPRKKRHTSVVLGHTSRELVVEHVDAPSRSPSLKEKILFQINTSKRDLFETVILDTATAAAPSILVTGFGLRNLTSLQDALQEMEYIKLQQLYTAAARLGSSSHSDTSSLSSGTQGSKLSTETNPHTIETETVTDYMKGAQYNKFKYLMGLPDGEEESLTKQLGELKLEAAEEKPEAAATEAMGRAQKYLCTHKIFEFFQFTICHLLSVTPEDPIDFILRLLDKCLYYRAGYSEPPVLYGPKHLECLFYLMDQTRTGYINLEQYTTGMHTVGLLSFNKKPHTTPDGLVRKEDFVAEAYESLTYLLDDIIRRRYKDELLPPPPPPTPLLSSSSLSSSCDEYRNTVLKSHMCL